MEKDQEKQAFGKDTKPLPKNFEVTALGSLGLLALGHVGIIAWKKKRSEEELNNKTNNE
ncbi:MAG: hypothetical protein K0S44_1930 [Bacteroidetes bacterium]|jgi:hypothetical protein|nr:hypothetical protein [Bacteroidota bacterium]